ncbi:5-oxoprolinase subunit PxpB [Paenibacillus beijingensis]|uniref:Kinase inhibitor n=1 Tax=Paenibacillus beijingensis TaxID=1126833 RepID=A0A0D5NGU7_9BACL|nr:5-oxoprolinase subunit PxpB [Paenibacillus beijingensis]AJY74128.1 kinase inhibitor [Paenibacillus beijingensis]
MNRMDREQAAPVRLFPLGDAAAVVQFGSRIGETARRKVQALIAILEQHPFPGLIEAVPAFVTVTVYYDPMKVADPHTGETWSSHSGHGIRSPFGIVSSLLSRLTASLGSDDEKDVSRIVEIPVCYGGELGPDLQEVAELNGLAPEEVIGIHSQADYRVHMIGFAPGFPYLGGMSERIAAPRRSVPRVNIEAGSVGIGGSQTGIYPIATPGGWRLIGRTPLKLFQPDRAEPSLLRAGDLVRFRPIRYEQYIEWGEDGT